MKYITPELEVIKFEISDVLATSAANPETPARENWETSDKVPFEVY